MTFEDERFLDELIDKLCDHLGRIPLELQAIVVQLSNLRKELAENTRQLAVIAENVLQLQGP